MGGDGGERRAGPRESSGVFRGLPGWIGGKDALAAQLCPPDLSLGFNSSALLPHAFCVVSPAKKKKKRSFLHHKTGGKAFVILPRLCTDLFVVGYNNKRHSYSFFFLINCPVMRGAVQLQTFTLCFLPGRAAGLRGAAREAPGCSLQPAGGCGFPHRWGSSFPARTGARRWISEEEQPFLGSWDGDGEGSSSTQRGATCPRSRNRSETERGGALP